jgi:hypothetical protein
MFVIAGARMCPSAPSRDRRSLEVRIPVRCVGYIGVACPGIIKANHRREGEAALRGDDAVPLPAADQQVLESAGPAPERQLIAEARTELVG